MKHLISLISLVVLSIAVHAQQPLDLTGNWKEMRRMDKNGSSVAFIDTFRIEFMIGNEYVWQQKGSFRSKGTYKATKDELDMGSRLFTIVRFNARQLVLKDENGTYELHNYTPPQVSEDNRNAGSSSRGDAAATGGFTINKKEMTGSWETYKRTSSVQLKELDYRRIIKKITFNTKGSDLNGAVIPAQNDQLAKTWKIDAYKNEMLYCSGPDDRELVVKKCADGELIIQEGTMTYFFKKSK